MSKEGLKRIPDKLVKTALCGTVILPTQARADLLSNTSELSQLDTGVKIALSLASLGIVLVSTAKALDFSHHAKDSAKYTMIVGVTAIAAAGATLIYCMWK